MPATIKDVAKAADVSIGTVSRVLNGHPTVNPSTTERVLRAVESLNYSRLRRPKQPGVTAPLNQQTIAIMMLGLDRSLSSLPSVASGIHGAESALASEGAEVLLSDLPMVDRIPACLSHQQTCGLLLKGALQGGLIPTMNPELLRLLKQHPTVWILGRPQQAEWGDTVASDDADAGRLAAEYFIARGHRRLAILNPKPDHVSLGQRCASFLWHATQSGASVQTVFGSKSEWKLPLHAVEDVQLIDQLVDQLLNIPDRPTAVFVPADCIAAMVYRACSARQVALGKDLSLISCNNELPLLTGLYPEVTTIDINAEQIGHQAVEQLIWRLQNREAPTVNVSVKPVLVEGMSVATL